MKAQRRIVKASYTVRLNLPKKFIDNLGIEINDLVDVELLDDKIIITKIKEGEG